MHKEAKRAKARNRKQRAHCRLDFIFILKIRLYQSILEGLIRAMPQLTERNQLI